MKNKFEHITWITKQDAMRRYKLELHLEEIEQREQDANQQNEDTNNANTIH